MNPTPCTRPPAPQIEVNPPLAFSPMPALPVRPREDWLSVTPPPIAMAQCQHPFSAAALVLDTPDGRVPLQRDGDTWRLADADPADLLLRLAPGLVCLQSAWPVVSIANAHLEGQPSLALAGQRLQDGLAFLATVGSTAPFIGLFGTVWGILNALTAIGIAGQASIDKVAGPVGESLLMTAIGLAVAVPAVLGYNWLVRRNKVAMDDVRAFGSDLHTVLLAANAKR